MKDAKGHGSNPRGAAHHQDGINQVGVLQGGQINRAVVGRTLAGHDFQFQGKGTGAAQGASRYLPGPGTSLDRLHSQLIGAGWLVRDHSMPEHLSDVREYGRPDSKQVITVYHKHGAVRGASVDTA